jgi:hypothetical protein
VVFAKGTNIDKRELRRPNSKASDDDIKTKTTFSPSRPDWLGKTDIYIKELKTLPQRFTG